MDRNFVLTSNEDDGGVRRRAPVSGGVRMSHATFQTVVFGLFGASVLSISAEGFGMSLTGGRNSTSTNSCEGQAALPLPRPRQPPSLRFQEPTGSRDPIFRGLHPSLYALGRDYLQTLPNAVTYALGHIVHHPSRSPHQGPPNLAVVHFAQRHQSRFALPA